MGSEVTRTMLPGEERAVCNNMVGCCMQAHIFRNRRSRIDSERRELHKILDERSNEHRENLLIRDLGKPWSVSPGGSK